MEGVQFPEKKHYITLECPLSQENVFHLKKCNSKMNYVECRNYENCNVNQPY